MALQTCRIGNVPNAIQWDDAIHNGAIETTEVIKAGTPVAANDVVILGSLPSLANYITSAAVIADHAIVRGADGARGVQDSLVTINDTGSIALPVGETVDGVDISVHAGNVNAHHAQSHDAVSHSDIASSGANIDDAVAKKHTQGTDTALGGVGTKNPPIDADKVIYRDSTAADVLVTSTWTQIKAFLRAYLDTIYHILGGDLGTPSAADLANATGLPTAGLATQVFAAGIGIGGAAADTGGVAFPATAVPSADPNTLDDYEEGTWTPVGTLVTPGDSSNANQLGYYQKVGNWITCTGMIHFTKGTGNGAFTMTGLPFIVLNVANYYSPIFLNHNYLGAAGEFPQALAMYNTTVIFFSMVPESATAVNSMTDTDFGTTSPVRVSLVYRTT